MIVTPAASAPASPYPPWSLLPPELLEPPDPQADKASAAATATAPKTEPFLRICDIPFIALSWAIFEAIKNLLNNRKTAEVI